eukprot:CAMPEP_0171075036 /NCGR_PEP_ID=MMETSP0766_2-20121228/12526_1 /TAXON_ID=439317 /ORGANISM="Gambierdiscus australes, Strain CAWD 149" /LENGTH=215 /DNA_ID=CAMNT_0011531867 /DNA_START=104 /DNA_END=752 /DNA_ORIENTATION=-
MPKPNPTKCPSCTQSKSKLATCTNLFHGPLGKQPFAHMLPNKQLLRTACPWHLKVAPCARISTVSPLAREKTCASKAFISVRSAGSFAGNAASSSVFTAPKAPSFPATVPTILPTSARFCLFCNSFTVSCSIGRKPWFAATAGPASFMTRETPLMVSATVLRPDCTLAILSCTVETVRAMNPEKLPFFCVWKGLVLRGGAYGYCAGARVAGRGWA